MQTETNNPQVAHWTDDPAQVENFFDEVDPTIDYESRRWIRFYGVSKDREDMASEIRLKFLKQMRENDSDGPFAKGSPKEAADFLKENYKIRNCVRSNARELGRKQRRQAKIIEERKQAEIFANVRPMDLPQDFEKRLFAVCRSLPLISEISNLTARESEIFRMEVLRRVDIDGLPTSVFDEFAQAAGISDSEERAYIKDHDKNGHSNPSDRKAWSRALAKVKKAFTQAKLLSLLVIVFAFALSLGLGIAIHSGRSMSQDDFVNQGGFNHQNARAHQDNLIFQNARAHQAT